MKQLIILICISCNNSSYKEDSIKRMSAIACPNNTLLRIEEDILYNDIVAICKNGEKHAIFTLDSNKPRIIRHNEK